MRDAAHYRKMFAGNPDASIGASLAAQAVYAARNGSYDHTAPGHDHEAYRAIYTTLWSKYGDTLTSDQVLAEMERPNHDYIRKMRRVLEEEIRTVIGMLLSQNRGADAGQVILALRRELTRHIKQEG